MRPFTILTVILALIANSYGDQLQPSPDPSCTVCTGGRDVTLRFDGIVGTNKDDFSGYQPIAGDLLIERRATVGAKVELGDPLHVYSTMRRQAAIPQGELELVRAESEYLQQQLTLTRRYEAMRSEQATAERERTVGKARLQALESTDADEVELLHRQYLKAQQAHAQAEAALQPQTELYRLGQVASTTVDAAQLAAKQAGLSMELAELSLTFSREPTDARQVESQKLILQRLTAKLDDEQSGMLKQLEVLEQKQASQRNGHEARRDAARRALHDAVKDSYDHAPLRRLTIYRGDELVKCFTFQPTSASVPEDWLADSGAVFDVDRGYGWVDAAPHPDRVVTFVSRDKEPPHDTLAIIRGYQQWRCKDVPGRLRLEFELGDAFEWTGTRIAFGAQVLHVANKIAADVYPTVTVEVDCTGDLELTFGMPHTKALYAEIPGTVTINRWSPGVGDHTWGGAWPMIFLAQPEKYYVNARVPRLYSDLFRKPDSARDGDIVPAANTSGDGQLELQHLATPIVDIVTAAGTSMSGTVSQVGSIPVRLSFAPLDWWKRNEQRDDKIARDVTIQPLPGEAASLALEAGVDILVSITVPDDALWVPLQFVAARGDQYFVHEYEAATPVAIDGFPLQDIFVVTAGVAGGDRLRIPPTTDQSVAAPIVYDGVVIPSAPATVYTPQDIWGQIEDLVPDGSTVTADQRIITLHNPWIEKRREENADKRRAAEQRYLQAASERRLKEITANVAHREKVYAERIARVAARESGTVETLAIATAENKRAKQQLVQQQSERGLTAMNGSAATAAELQEAQHQADLATLESKRQHLAVVAAQRSRDWLKVHEAQIDWTDAREALGVRERDLKLARQEEQVTRMQSRFEFEDSLKGNRREQAFERHKVICAPAAGRIFYRMGYNSIKNQPDKIDKGFHIWSGLAIADILDMNELAIEVELPERLYPQLQSDVSVTVAFPHLGSMTLPARVDKVGRRFFQPSNLNSDQAGAQAISSRKVFTAVFVFNPPAELHDRLIPGVKGKVILK
jgi:hypothetical protein